MKRAIQTARSGTFTFNNGDLRAHGFEFDFTAAPVTGITLGGSLGCNDSKFSNVNPLAVTAYAYGSACSYPQAVAGARPFAGRALSGWNRL